VRRARAIAVLTLVIAALVVGACASETHDERSPADSALVVDTDGGADDAMALLFLLQDPRLHIAAITVSGTGLVHCPTGAANVAGLVALARPSYDIPVACGASAPLEGDRAFPEEWRTQADGRYGGILPDGQTTRRADAVDLLTAVASDATRPVRVLTLGPLTNLASALERSPEIADHIERVVIMGGAFDVPGNITASGSIAEWNIYVDPVAAQRVLDSGVPVTFVPLDAQVPVDPYVVRTLERAASTPEAEVVARLLASDPFFVSGSFFLWDPLAATFAVEPSLFTTTSARVSVVTNGTGAGWTTKGAGTEVTIADPKIDDDVIASYLGALDGRSVPLPVSRTPDAVISADRACRAAPAQVPSGPIVLALDSPFSGAAIGTLDPGHTVADIEAFVATAPAGAPPWFHVSAVLQSGDSPSSTLVALPGGNLTVVCASLGESGAISVQGLTTLTVS